MVDADDYGRDERMLNEGDIAYCCQGHLGLILRVKGSPVSGMMYYGIHLSQERFGQPWESKNPQEVGNIHVLLATLDLEEANT